MASFWYNKFFIDSMKASGNVDLDTDTVKISLFGTGYTPSKQHDFMGDTTPGTNELSVTGYTGGFGGSGRKSLTTKAVNEDTTNNRVIFDADDVTWTALGSGGTIATAVFLKEVTNDAASPLILQLDINPDVSTNGGDVTIQFAAGATLGIGYVAT